MSRLAALQQRFQQCVLEPGAGHDLSWIAAGGRAGSARQLSAYAHAYAARLQEVLAGDYPAVHAALGSERFEALAEQYLHACPSRFFSLRDFGRDLPGFIAARADHGMPPWMAELARFEWTLGLAFDAADAPLATVSDMAAIAPGRWPALRFEPHPSVHCLELAWNTVSLRDALVRDAAGDVAALADEPVCWLVWRHEFRTQFRSLAPDESALLAALLAGDCFGDLCAALAESQPADEVPLRAATLLKTWLDQGLISRIRAGG